MGEAKRWSGADPTFAGILALFLGLHALSCYVVPLLLGASKRFAGRLKTGFMLDKAKDPSSCSSSLVPGEKFPGKDGEVYLDHAGATLYSCSQVAEYASFLTDSGPLGNPHSRSPASLRSSEVVARARAAVLEHFNACGNEYVVIFTSGCTAACKLVGENFPWQAGRSVFAYSRANHNSVLGIRSLAKKAGCAFRCLPGGSLDEWRAGMEGINGEEGEQKEEGEGKGKGDDKEGGGREDAPCLFAFPAECNFSGQK